MKIKLGILAILLSTITLIALIYTLVNLDSAPKVESEANNPPQIEKDDPESLQPPASRDEPAEPRAQAEPQHEILSNQEPADIDLSPQDRTIINSVASLGDKELADEIASLKTRLKQEDLLEQLEDGDLEEEEAHEAKKLLERFSLLGLEETRRKYQNIEPELKNPLYAHRDSLKEIREMLDEY